nr:MAG TPA: hypothetical protein [Caudoviricetes sp.]
MTTPKLSNGGKRAVIGAILLLVLAIVAGLVYYYDKQKDESPKVLTTEQTKDPDAVAKKVRVSQPAAQTIVREIERTSGEAPAITYYVQSPTLDRAAETVQKQIETKSPEAPAGVTAKSDRTIVTADNKLNKVDVYKISLRRAHKLKAGMTYVNDKSYLSAGYQAGRWEGLAHFDGSGFRGATVMYTIKEW